MNNKTIAIPDFLIFDIKTKKEKDKKLKKEKRDFIINKNKIRKLIEQQNKSEIIYNFNVDRVCSLDFSRDNLQTRSDLIKANHDYIIKHQHDSIKD